MMELLKSNKAKLPHQKRQRPRSRSDLGLKAYGFGVQCPTISS
jgi:hypothetical protein